MNLLDRIRERSERLPRDLQREVLDFIEFLDARRQTRSWAPTSGDDARSCLDLAVDQGLVGCMTKGPPDLSTNPDHLQDYGT